MYAELWVSTQTTFDFAMRRNNNFCHGEGGELDFGDGDLHGNGLGSGAGSKKLRHTTAIPLPHIIFQCALSELVTLGEANGITSLV